MALAIAEHELFHACRILFGAELNITRDFLEYLQFSGLKTAYRKRAFETHPDRVAAQDSLAQRRHNDLFRQVQSAYEDLASYLDAREKGVILTRSSAAGASTRYRNPSPARPAGPTRPRQHAQHGSGTTSNFHQQWSHRRQQWQKTNTNRNTGRNSSTQGRWNINNLFEGTLPERELRLGHFLYYSGLISWHQIIQALIWQRTHRPRLGELGRRFGWLSDQDILSVLQSRRSPEPFGSAAIGLGLLTEKQLQTLIWRQRSLQRKFGEFFIENEILAAAELRELILRHRQHNARQQLNNRYSSFRW